MARGMKKEKNNTIKPRKKFQYFFFLFSLDTTGQARLHAKNDAPHQSEIHLLLVLCKANRIKNIMKYVSSFYTAIRTIT